MGIVTATLHDMTTSNQNYAATDYASTTVGTAQAGHRPVARTRARIRGRRALAVLGAAAAALAIWAIAVPLAGADLTVRMNGTTQPIGPGSVVGSTLIAALVGWALLAVLERVVRRPRRIWTINAVVALAISMAGPLTSATGATTTLTLIGMHLAVGAVLIPVLRSTTRP
jgi:hypothetical protein